MNTAFRFIGIAAAVFSMVLWMILCFFNPYDSITEKEPIVRTFLNIFLPAFLALLGALTTRRWLLLLAFFWSLPFSLYFVLTPGIFAFFGLSSVLYFICFIFMRNDKKTVVS